MAANYDGEDQETDKASTSSLHACGLAFGPTPCGGEQRGLHALAIQRQESVACLTIQRHV